MDARRERLFTSIEGKKAEVLRRLEALTSERYAAGDWSPAQIGYHLTRAEEAIRAVPDGVKTRRTPVYFVGCALLRAAVSLPSRAREEPRSDMPLAELTARWDAVREALRVDLETARPGELFCQHPVFGPLDADAYLPFLDAHLAYHLKRWPHVS